LVDSTTFDEAKNACLLASSYQRIRAVFDCLGELPQLEWFRLLGEEWTVCDSIWHMRGVLRLLLRRASRAELDAMMEPSEREALAQMPETFTVYRGCYQINLPGLSWSLERAIAEQFPTKMRYCRYGELPLLRTGVVRRDVLKHDRAESEIIAPTVKIVCLEPIW
jgi:hypothetical protein